MPKAKTETKALTEAALDVTVYYDGKCVSMEYVTEPARRFAAGCVRIQEHAPSGLVVRGYKVYAVIQGSRTARKLVHEQDLEEALRTIRKAK